MRKLILGSVAIAALIVGCGSGKSINGKWNVASSAQLPPGSSVTAKFSGTDNLLMVMDIKQPLPTGKSIGLHAEIKGTYKLEGENMSIKADSVKFSGSDFRPS